MEMKMSPEYNGHKNWTYWNVALWINNDPGLYSLARQCRTEYRSLKRATEAFLDALYADAPDWTLPHTQDGARFTKAAVYAALKGIEK